jgi:imidazolonepropionase-like amidohydrolase
MRTIVIAILLLFVGTAFCQKPDMSSDVTKYVRVQAPVIALTHVRVIDGTGSPAREDQTIVVDHGTIAKIGPSAQTAVPPDAKEIDYRGYTIIPGIVGMHDHLYYTAWLNRGSNGHLLPPGFIVTELPYTAPLLYLATGVTTMRTTGSIEPYTDFQIKHLVDTNQMPGPAIHTTGPYLEGANSVLPQVHFLTGADDVRRMVDFWADSGATDFKAYMNISRAELDAAINEAHKRGTRLTAHLCSVTWREAAAMGIDDLEHGPVFTDSEFVKDKKPDTCPSGREIAESWAKLDVKSAPVKEMIADLIAHHVAVTSTLPVFESGLSAPQQRVLDAMSPESRISFLTSVAQMPEAAKAARTAMLKKEMQFELAFARAGGVLLAGPDPTGNGGVLPGFGDQREIELLADAGFTPLEAIHIATANGAAYLGEADHIGTLAPGKQADMVVIDGNPVAQIKDIEKTIVVFKDGVGYDSQKLVDAIRGQVGTR